MEHVTEKEVVASRSRANKAGALDDGLEGMDDE
jgi:hypothetical protein